MTAKELAGILDIQESTIINQFARTKARFEKQGIKITKNGRGKKADYSYEIITSDDNRALTVFDEIKDENMGFKKELIQKIPLLFYSFVAILSTPMCVFRGTYKDFLAYMAYATTPENIEAVKSHLRTLADEGYIMYSLDKTDPNYFIAGVYRKIENEAEVGVKMVKACKQICDKNSVEGKRYNFIHLLKVYIAAQLAQKNQPYTLAEMEELTGLSVPTIRKYEELLVKENVCLLNKVYYKDFVGNRVVCGGKEIEFNAIESWEDE